jgi:hypothetical protein
VRTPVVVVLVALFAIAQTAVAQPARPATPPAPEKKTIEDNSFLAEEAFNQEDRVVQHISQFVRDRVTKSWLYAFTQEWPVGGQLHQLSYTITFGNSPGYGSGLGDAMLNYRYQAVADEESGVFSSPRLSVVLPTGKRGLGTGSLGIQAVVPISIRLGDQFITHIDPGYTHFSSARLATGERGSLGSLSFAHSIIWLATERFNVMLETTWAGNAYRVNGRDIWDASLLLNPGVRWSYNLASGMQIVPGVSFPIGVGPSKGDKSVLLYLSFEHPY